jgi:predicted nucleic acid-binding protein
MILIDTSAWIEFLRDTGTPTCEAVDRLLATDIATCDAVRMEVLAGARDEAHLVQLRGLLARTTTLPTEPGDYETAAALHRACRRGGETVRKLIDCLIAAIAIREAVAVLHLDADFDVLTRHTALRVHGVTD